MKVSVDKSGTPGELVELEHHGVKGMKWGQRKSSSSSPSFKQRFPTHQARRAEILRARSATAARGAKVALATTPSERTKATKVYLNNPDRATAMRMTRGEKVVASLVAVGFAAPSAGLVPLAVAGYTGAGVASRRRIQKTQARGGY